ncbi:MAG: glucose 1-dehydrogenase [Thermodesulfobacteriota bacterium]
MTATAGDLRGKVALVTGGSRGIGRAVAERLAANGATVAINYRTGTDAARALRDELRARGGVAEAFAADVADEAAVRAMLADVAGAFGRIDVLVNNVGALVRQALGAIDRAGFAAQVDVNVWSVVAVTQAALPYFPEGGGRIVNVASNLALSPVAGFAVCAATKAAVIALTRAFARELGARRITVNAVAPGAVETEMMQGVPEERRRYLERYTPLGGMGKPEEIADVVAFLASDASRRMTGQTVVVDGGLV